MQARPQKNRNTASPIVRLTAALVPESTRWIRACLLVCVAAGSTLTVACDDTYQEETDLFEEAERHYQHGDYEGAVDRYEQFLVRHPRSQLAPIAEQRILIVRSELDSVMERRNVEPPIRVNAYRQPLSGGQ